MNFDNTSGHLVQKNVPKTQFPQIEIWRNVGMSMALL